MVAEADYDAARSWGAASRKLLATPPIIVVAFYIGMIVALTTLIDVAVEPARSVLTALFSWSAWICAVVWSFALYSVAHPAIRMGRGLIGKAGLSASLISFIVSIVLQGGFGVLIQGPDPVSFGIIFVPCLLAVVGMGFAVSALDTFEGGNGWPFTPAMSNTITAILFLPIGIWFLRGRINRLLSETA